ncbi:MAG: SDR family NAD(P)-dependent oxidoreductase, partial [Sediminibacterium sp.]
MKAVITGASQGIGKAIADHFAAAGYDLFLCSRGEVRLYHALEELQAKYPERQLYARPTDMSQQQEAEAFAQWTLSFGVPDVLVNNAGQFIQGSISEEAA